MILTHGCCWESLGQHRGITIEKTQGVLMCTQKRTPCGGRGQHILYGVGSLQLLPPMLVKGLVATCFWGPRALASQLHQLDLRRCCVLLIQCRGGDWELCWHSLGCSNSTQKAQLGHPSPGTLSCSGPRHQVFRSHGRQCYIQGISEKQGMPALWYPREYSVGRSLRLCAHCLL